MLDVKYAFMKRWGEKWGEVVWMSSGPAHTAHQMFPTCIYLHVRRHIFKVFSHPDALNTLPEQLRLSVVSHLHILQSCVSHCVSACAACCAVCCVCSRSAEELLWITFVFNQQWARRLMVSGVQVNGRQIGPYGGGDALQVSDNHASCSTQSIHTPASSTSSLSLSHSLQLM